MVVSPKMAIFWVVVPCSLVSEVLAAFIVSPDGAITQKTGINTNLTLLSGTSTELFRATTL